jgi:cytochrome P450
VAALGAQVFRSAGSPYGSLLRSQGEAASLELTSIFQKSPIPGGKQTYIGISQTLPRLMANGWVALLQHPSELAHLRDEPQLMPRAVEELMRYAPTIHIISRRAMDDVVLNGLSIAKDAQVNLLVASANRDPQQFPDPDRLDVSRVPSSQVALGFGRDFCAGAAIVRMVYAVTTAALLKSFREIAPAGPVDWHRHSESCWPNSVRVTFQRNGNR